MMRTSKFVVLALVLLGVIAGVLVWQLSTPRDLTYPQAVAQLESLLKRVSWSESTVTRKEVITVVTMAKPVLHQTLPDISKYELVVNPPIASNEVAVEIFASVEKLGAISTDETYLQKHIDAVLDYPLVNAKAIGKKNFKIVVDAINSTGAIFVPALLRALGVTNIILLNKEVNGKFAHNPEPLPEHLSGLSNEVIKHRADLGIAVDPDVDRLCFVCEDGSMFGEEYTLVAVSDYVLEKKKGNTVSNMSSTKALKEITIKHGGEYFPSAVGEVNVVNKMKEVHAVIGGEGNGGIIVPDFHYGRDALIGIGLFLSHLATQNKSIKSLRQVYPDYFISKNKIDLENGFDVKNIFEKIKKKYKNHPVNTEDGLKIEFDNDWVHLRTSNTEPIIRIYAESDFETKANNIALRLMQDIKEFM